MNVVPALLLFWVWLPSSGAACTTAYGGKIHYCKTFQTDYIEGMEILIFEERDVGRINSTVLSSPNLKSVLSLTLKGSKIHTIESGAFQQFKGLDILELQNNRLTTLSPSWFHDPGTLKNLTMANNSIGHLHPKMLDGFSNLEWLNLSLNQITSIHIESFRSLSKMVSLDLSYNKISSLRWQTLSPLNGTLRLGGNPWNCSCAHKGFILFLKELLNASRLTDPISVTCHYPPDLMGALMWNLTEMNCSLHAPPPLPEAVFYKVVLPVLFIVLAVFVFILLIFLLWKKKQDQKQVRPDKRMKEVAGVRFPRTFGDGVAVNTNLVGFKITSSQYPAALGRTKSAAAILLQAEFNSTNVMQSQKRSEKSQAANSMKDCCNAKMTSEGDMEMWYYDNLQCKVYHTFNANSSNVEDASTRPPVVSMGPVESDDYSTRSTANIDEPLVYLCINTAREESTMTIPVKKTRPPYKPQIIRRALSWPNVQCKKESKISYEDFLKTLKPGGSFTTQEKNKRVDSGDLPNATQVLRPNQGLLRMVAIKNNSSLDGSPKNKVADDKFRQGNMTRNVYQRSGKEGRAPRSKVVTPDSEVNRDGLPSQGSDARSELRSTPDDEQLLENNEYSFIDLLHEVVQNHGRWTRERWKQTHQQRMSSRTSTHP